MNVIFIGDIVGPDAATYVARRVPELRRRHEASVVVANAENIAVSGDGSAMRFGMTTALVDRLFGSGVDVLTGGNHSWDGPAADDILCHPRVLRPHNMPAGTPGHGIVTVEAAGEYVTILNLTDPRTIPEALPVFPSWLSLKAEGRLIGTVVIDLHSNHASGKQAFAYAVDGEVGAVLGTDTHEPTLPLRILPGGTAQVTDVGMTGPTGGCGGIASEYRVAVLRGTPAALPPVSLAPGQMVLGAVLLRVAEGRTRAIERLS